MYRYHYTGLDCLGPNNGWRFSTYDHDKDYYSSEICAARYTGAWWYVGCGSSNLNEDYNMQDGFNGVFWAGYPGSPYIKSMTMMVRCDG